MVAMSARRHRSKSIASKTSGAVERLVEGIEIVDKADAAKELGVTANQIQKLVYQGRLGSHVFGRFLITRQELEEFKKIPRPVGRPPID